VRRPWVTGTLNGLIQDKKDVTLFIKVYVFEGIFVGEKWWERIDIAIESSDNSLFVMKKKVSTLDHRLITLFD
jgi:hypothetical protein